MIPLAGKTFDLEGSWETLWTGIKGSTGQQVWTLLSVIGVAIVVGALIKWIWDRKRGGGGRGLGNTGAIWGALAVGALLTAPEIILPILLTILDAIVNAIIGIWNQTK